MKNRIEKYGFIENQDFEVFHNFMENPNGGRPLIEYALSIDCAKEISMVDEDEKLTYTIRNSGQNHEMWFLTENGLYEVLKSCS